MSEDKSIDSTPFVNSQGMTETRFDDSNPVSSGSANLQADKNRVKSWVKGMFEHLTGTREVKDLGRDTSRKEGEQVLTTDMGLIETGVSQKPTTLETTLSTPTVFEPIKANNTEKEDMAATIAAGPTSPTEDRERQIAQEVEANARQDIEDRQKAEAEAKKNDRVPGDPTVYKAFNDKQDELRHNAFNPTSWMERESNDTQNLKKGAVEADIAARAAKGELDADGIRAELFKTGNYDDLESVDQAAQKIEEQNTNDRNAIQPIFDEDLIPTPRLETSDRNQSVLDAEADVSGHLGMMERNRQMDEADAAAAKNDRELVGEGWKVAHGDNESTNRLEDSDQNQSVLAAEAEVERQKRVNEYERKKAEAEADEAQADRESSGRSWIDAHRDNSASERREYSDRNPSVQAAEQDVNDFFTKQREAQELKDYDIGETGKRWSALDKLEKPTPPPSRVGKNSSVTSQEEAVEKFKRDLADKQAREQADREVSGDAWRAAQDQLGPDRLTESDRNQSVLDAETDVTGHLGMMERNRQMDADDASAARAERVKAGGRWIDIHDDDRDEGRQTKSDNNPSVMAAEREVTGPFGAEERQRIANDFDAGATEIEDRIGAPIEDGEIVVRRRQPLLAEPDTDPEVKDQREQTAERLRRSGSSWRRRLAIAGMAALMLFAKDRGPANPVADPGVAPVNTAPFVPMPEIGGNPEFSPLDALPKMKATFPTIGPSGESITPQQADLGQWFNAEWVKQYKQSHPGQFNDNGFDMRSPYDINLLNRIRADSTYQDAYKQFMDYVATHEIRGGNKDMQVDIQRKDDGSIDKIIVDVPNQGGYDVPDIKSLYNMVSNQ